VRTNSAIIAGFSNLPGRIAADSSALYAKNLVNLTPLLVSKEGAFAPQLDDEIVKGAMLTNNGSIVHPTFAGGA
jgi:NAD(P) transhydrogenase subunit alpha